MGTGGHNVPLVVTDDGLENSPRECFNFQGFPKNFKPPKEMANSICTNKLEMQSQ